MYTRMIDCIGRFVGCDCFALTVEDPALKCNSMLRLDEYNVEADVGPPINAGRVHALYRVFPPYYYPYLTSTDNPDNYRTNTQWPTH